MKSKEFIISLEEHKYTALLPLVFSVLPRESDIYIANKSNANGLSIQDM